MIAKAVKKGKEVLLGTVLCVTANNFVLMEVRTFSRAIAF